MGLNELQAKYKSLRHELEDAYAAPAWNRPRIDHLADEIAATEQALVACHLQEPDSVQMPLEFAG